MYTEQFQISKEYNLMLIMNIYIYYKWIILTTNTLSLLSDKYAWHYVFTQKTKKENLMYSKMWKMIQWSESWKIFVNEIDTESASLILSTLLK